MVVTFTPQQIRWLQAAAEEANGNVVVWTKTVCGEAADIEVVWVNKDNELHGRVVHTDGRFGVTNAPE